MIKWVDDYMAFYEFQGRKKDQEIKPYIYLARSYRDEDGVVRKDRIYLGKDEDKRKFSYKDECKKCGTKSDEPIYLVLEDGSIKEASEDISMLEAYHEACKKDDIESIRVGQKPITKKNNS